MLILPAIDIRRGNCVRLYQGRAEQETVYSSDPVEMARLWKSRGAKMLHVVDLDGAFEGRPVHLALIGALRYEANIPIEAGGGFRDIASIQTALDQGIDKVILGTAAIYHPELVMRAVELFGDSVSVSIDVRDSFATAAGWKEISAIPFTALAAKMREAGVAELLFTDTRRDGALRGVDLAAIKSFLGAAQVPVTVSGGITTLEDLRDLKALEPLGLKGVVIGKALYDKKIQLEDALRIAG